MTIVVRHLQKKFGKQTVVDDVSFEIAEGELVALLGPSGGGKSTVLRIIAGLEQPDQGQILIMGEDATNQRIQDRNIGFVFQNYALFRHMTVEDNIAFGLSVRNVHKDIIQRTVNELLDLIQLQGYAKRFPAQLSGGQRQRVALARAIASNPKLLLLDEPFGALDVKVRVELRNWVRRLHKEKNMTSVFVTHDQEEAMDLADRVIIMNRGKIEQIGTPDEIYNHPATEFVAGFLGTINVLEGHIREGRASLGGLSLRVHEGLEDGTNVRAFVRPHEIELTSLTQEASPPSAIAVARIEAILRIGPMVRYELEMPDGQKLTVQVTKERSSELGVCEGETVFVNVKEAKLFVQDYVI